MIDWPSVFAFLAFAINFVLVVAGLCTVVALGRERRLLPRAAVRRLWAAPVSARIPTRPAERSEFFEDLEQ